MREAPEMPTHTLTQLDGPVLVLGPAHAGKSELAIQLLAPDRAAVVLGTSTLRHEAMERRLGQLAALRPPTWETIAVTRDLPVAVDDALGRAPQLLVDSVSQWLAAVVVGDADEAPGEAIAAAAAKQVDELLALIAARPQARVVLVSAEAGAAPTPGRPMERLYRRLVGETNRRLAAAARSVVVVHAGIPLVIKS
jgi:adenosylcobinamide kinase/adenosylcobinamide-phosphate guanylyltransferase